MLYLICVILVASVVIPFVGYYMVFALAKANILWTVVEQGWCRIILRYGRYRKTVGPGLRWVGLPGINTLYGRTMKFLKSVTDASGNAKAEPHDDKDIRSFKLTRYPYGLPFNDEEDSHGLNLSGLLAVFAVIEDYRQAFFGVSDWYAEMNTRILSCWRELLVNFSYDEDIVGRNTKEEQARRTVSQLLWEALNSSPDEDRPSILDDLRRYAGIRVEAVQLVSIDPPEGWRATTLAPYKASREAAAAVEQAKASATLFDDTNQALQKWLESHPQATPSQIAEKQRELRERALAKTSGYQQVDIRGLENASTAVVGGGGAGMLVGGQGGGRGQGNRGGSKKGKKPSEMTDDELIDGAF